MPSGYPELPPSLFTMAKLRTIHFVWKLRTTRCLRQAHMHRCTLVLGLRPGPGKDACHTNIYIAVTVTGCCRGTNVFVAALFSWLPS